MLRILMAEAFGLSISGWSMGLLRIRAAMVAAVGLQGQVWFWAARQPIAPAGIPSGAGVWRLQPTWFRGVVCRLSPLPPPDRWAGHGNAWTSSSGGTDQSIRSTPLATRAAFTFTTTATGIPSHLGPDAHDLVGGVVLHPALQAGLFLIGASAGEAVAGADALGGLPQRLHPPAMELVDRKALAGLEMVEDDRGGGIDLAGATIGPLQSEAYFRHHLHDERLERSCGSPALGEVGKAKKQLIKKPTHHKRNPSTRRSSQMGSGRAAHDHRSRGRGPNPVSFSRLRQALQRASPWRNGVDFGWIDVPVFDGSGTPAHERGVTASAGLYFIGLPWLHTWGSARFCGVAEDADHLAETIRMRLQRSDAGQERLECTALLGS